MTKSELLRLAALESSLVSLGFTPDEFTKLRRISLTLRRWPYADRETGALRRLASILAAHDTLAYYVQTDPRGAALYILRPGDVPPGEDKGSYYTRGICVY